MDNLNKNKKPNDDPPKWISLVNQYAQQKDKVNTNSKPRFKGGLYGLLFKRLAELENETNMKSGIVRFPVVFQKICRTFSIDKQGAWELLFMLQDMGMIEIVPYQGVRLKAKSSFNSI